ncbi:uncharacterized protein LOC112905961 [Agrilus planipennis]|uniref:Uncharacterized protein LOC112905961 n=1 Tax=Agrilus planipennis TaxID=224129 RepID=A0A7F5RGW7_AGRPL|nr:uncharacterized protein LOC112905961 [Agrilus planipennis]
MIVKRQQIPKTHLMQRTHSHLFLASIMLIKEVIPINSVSIVKGSPASSERNLTGSPRVAKDIIADVYNAIQHWNDHHIKGQLVLESIAHSRNINEAMFYAALWTHQPYVSDSTIFKVETLLVESGHKKF